MTAHVLTPKRNSYSSDARNSRVAEMHSRTSFQSSTSKLDNSTNPILAKSQKLAQCPSNAYFTTSRRVPGLLSVLPGFPVYVTEASQIEPLISSRAKSLITKLIEFMEVSCPIHKLGIELTIQE